LERFSALLGLLAVPLLTTQQEHSLTSEMLTCAISAVATLGVIVRPFDLPEAIWAVAGALLLVVLGLIPLGAAWTGINKGVDVYLFLFGMMLLSEVAREEGLFDWLAAKATAHASGSPIRLFALIYLVGVLVTVFLSNDATAVVLTPAVCAAPRAAKVKNPKPYLLICAFTANAASFVLPISNPANLVLYGAGHVPRLGDWLAMFLLPSIVSIVVTYVALWLTQRQALADDSVAPHDGQHHLSFTAKAAAAAIVSTAGVLLACSRYGYDLGLPTFLAGLAASAIIIALRRHDPARILRGISMEHHSASRGAFRAGRGACAHRLHPELSSHACRPRAARHLGSARCRIHDRDCLEPREQSADWSHCQRRNPASASAERHLKCNPNGRRFGAESFGNRIACDNPMAHSSAPRWPQCHDLAVLKDRNRGDVPGARPLAAGADCARVSRRW
jgi:arsenical pump membrane protein